MNESQKRRETLLKETRQLYRNGYVPVVHPRYRAVYRNLYEEENSNASQGTLGTRILISLILFAVFAAADYNGTKIWRYTPTQIVWEIQKQPDFSGYMKDL